MNFKALKEIAKFVKEGRDVLSEIRLEISAMQHMSAKIAEQIAENEVLLEQIRQTNPDYTAPVLDPLQLPELPEQDFDWEDLEEQDLEGPLDSFQDEQEPSKEPVDSLKDPEPVQAEVGEDEPFEDELFEEATTYMPLSKVDTAPTSAHQGEDWSNVGLGPNVSTSGPAPLVQKIALKKPFSIDPVVAQKFNAYAAAAFPNEIGGLLRIQENDDEFRAIDIKIFSHLVSNGAYFELDGTEVAKFNMSLVKAGKSSEISEWNSLVHSHPGFSAFLSGTDRENLQRLAGKGHAWSVICSAHPNSHQNNYLVFHAQGGPLKMVTSNIIPENHDDLLGLNLLSYEQLAKIGRETQQALKIGV